MTTERHRQGATARRRWGFGGQFCIRESAGALAKVAGRAEQNGLPGLPAVALAMAGGPFLPQGWIAALGLLFECANMVVQLPCMIALIATQSRPQSRASATSCFRPSFVSS